MHSTFCFCGEAAETLEIAHTMIPDGLRYLAALTGDATEAIRSRRMRALGDKMVESWKRGQPS